jgi:hypothetical protein
VSDIDTAVVDSLKALDPKRPIREADIVRHVGLMAQSRPSQLRHYLAARMTIRKRENILILLGCTSCPMDQANYHV